jgi:hypothetical protein
LDQALLKIINGGTQFLLNHFLIRDWMIQFVSRR